MLQNFHRRKKGTPEEYYDEDDYSWNNGAGVEIEYKCERPMEVDCETDADTAFGDFHYSSLTVS